jgi:hypothetical protein
MCCGIIFTVFIPLCSNDPPYPGLFRFFFFLSFSSLIFIYRCEQGTNEVELKEKLCIEGCTLFCGVHPTANAGGFAPHPDIHKVL